jgi:hypothetical protein
MKVSKAPIAVLGFQDPIDFARGTRLGSIYVSEF